MNKTYAALGLALLLACVGALAQTSKELKARELTTLHDLRAVHANGELYLKGELLTAARELLKREGAARGLSKAWNAENVHWKQAEAALVEPIWQDVRARFASANWLRQQWVELNLRDFSETDLDALLEHFKGEIGYQQLRMLDHALANNVLGAFSLTWRMKTDVPGTEKELARTQAYFYRGDEAMIFDVVNSQEGIRFAFTPYGKRYTYDIVTNVVLMFVRELQALAAAMPQQLLQNLSVVAPSLEAFARD